jgi:putative ABC transport system permease protein
MKVSVLLRMAWQSITRNTMRTLLTMLGIVIGVGAVIIMVAIGNGAQRQIEGQIANLGTNLIVITPGAAQTGGASQGAQSFNRLTIDDMEKIQREASLLAALSPVVTTRAQVISPGGNWRTEVNGVASSFFQIRNWPIASGVAFSDEDVRSKRTVVLLGKTVAAGLFPDGDAVGQRVRRSCRQGTSGQRVGSGRCGHHAVYHRPVAHQQLLFRGTNPGHDRITVRHSGRDR